MSSQKLPDFSQIQEDETNKEFLTELKAVLPTLAGSIFVGILICLIVVAVMRWIAIFISWASIILFMGVIFGRKNGFYPKIQTFF